MVSNRNSSFATLTRTHVPGEQIRKTFSSPGVILNSPATASAILRSVWPDTRVSLDSIDSGGPGKESAFDVTLIVAADTSKNLAKYDTDFDIGLALSGCARNRQSPIRKPLGKHYITLFFLRFWHARCARCNRSEGRQAVFGFVEVGGNVVAA